MREAFADECLGVGSRERRRLRGRLRGRVELGQHVTHGGFGCQRRQRCRGVGRAHEVDRDDAVREGRLAQGARDLQRQLGLADPAHPRHGTDGGPPAAGEALHELPLLRVAADEEGAAALLQMCAVRLRHKRHGRLAQA